MKLYYYRDSAGNFGDDLNGWLWPRLIPELLDDDPRSLFVGIGTILDDSIPRSGQKYVFGSGCGYAALPAVDDAWTFYFVRGPLTAQRLGLPPGAAITDPALLVRRFASRSERPARPFSFMPHHVTAFLDEIHGLGLAELCAELGISYIDPRSAPADVLPLLADSRVVIAEAMHGAIVADALRVPWVPVRLSGQVLDFKWQDWCLSLGLEYEPLALAAGAEQRSRAQLRSLLRSALLRSPVLSDEAVSEDRLGRVEEQLERLRADHAAAVQVARPPLAADERDERDEREPRESWWAQILAATREIRALVPDGSSIVLVEDGQWEIGTDLSGRRIIPFSAGGGSCDPPADDASAVAVLEALRRSGAEFIVFAWPSFWWLDHYRALQQHLDARYARVLENERLIAFDLRP